MKESAIKQIEQEIEDKTKIPSDFKAKIRKEIYINIAIAIVLIICFILLILGSVGTDKNVRTTDFHIFSIVFLAIAIILFEYSYRKEKGKIAAYGIEFLAIAIFTLFLPYIIFELDETYKKYYLLVNLYIGVYYLIKSIYIYIKSKKEFMNSISDVKEIVRKDKRKRIITENSERPISENSIHNQLEGNNNENTKPKKRGRPKKEQVKESKDITSNKPKKRGRPRKVVESND